MIGGYTIEGHAIVSSDDRIADETGLTPPTLRNEADWRRFQTALDNAVITALGRLAHEANPNRKGRNRMVLSSSAHGIEQRADAWWWNPADISLVDALAEAAPIPGVVAVPGGRRVFDLFLSLGFDAFHLACAANVTIRGGIPVFSQVAQGRSAEDILVGRGLVAESREVLDPIARVDLTVWRRA